MSEQVVMINDEGEEIEILLDGSNNEFRLFVRDDHVATFKPYQPAEALTAFYAAVGEKHLDRWQVVE